MNVSQQFAWTPEAIRALAPAVERADNFGWIEINDWMRGHGWSLWNIGGQAWAFTLVNMDDEIEVLLAGGRGARACVKPFVEAVKNHPAHAGMTLVARGRRGWRRLLTDWTQRADGTLELRIA